MSKVVYRVSRPRLERLHIEASIAPDETVSVLTMRETYGPARGFPSGISNLTVEGPEAKATITPGKMLVVSSAPFTLTYDCAVPEYADAVSLLRGFHRGKAVFVPGMALFYRLHDQQSEYEVNIKAAAVCSRPAAAITELAHDCHRYGHPADLERAYFVLGDVVTRTVNSTNFVHEPGFPFALDKLLELWPRLLREIGRIFGENRSRDWTVFLFASDEHLAGRPGVGFSLPRGALASVSTRDDALDSPHTLWLLMHEFAHQWLGEVIGRADPADDWFFEGFTNFTACEALIRANLLSGPSLARLLSLSVRAIRQARSSGESALAHQGFLCAQRWNRLLSRQGNSLGNVLAAMVATHRGETLKGEFLLAALAQASPDGKVPDFLLRLAADANSFVSPG